MALKKAPVKCYTLKAPKSGKIYTTCKSVKTGNQLRKIKPKAPKKVARSKVARRVKQLDAKFRRKPPPPPPPPSRDIQSDMLRRGINPDRVVFM